MRLDETFGAAEVLETRGDPTGIDVTMVTHDSRAAAPGTLFCCLPGRRVDGHDYAPGAVDAGAVALLVERFVAAPVPQGRVGDARRALALAAAHVAGRPADALTVLSVTGTDGKTTTARLLEGILEAHGWPSAVIGTLSGAGTTPDPPLLHDRLRGFVAEGRRAVVLEASAHGLAQRRVDGIRSAVAVFTNLSQDHLNDFAGMEEYFAAKARLFQPDLTAAGVVNADDEHGRRLLADAAVPMTAFSWADVSDVELGPSGSTFRWRGTVVHTALPGRHNVMNALAAATAATVLGIDDRTIAAGIAGVARVAGRFERVDSGDLDVIVDYAHTPAGLENALTAARDFVAPGGRLLIVFGAGGDRDRAKRPRMGAVAARLADRAWLTSDNPRSEDADAIIAEVAAGAGADAGRSDRFIIEPDRAAAIGAAVADARSGDVVLIAGKGHETGQEIGGVVHPFDDREVARAALRRRAQPTAVQERR